MRRLLVLVLAFLGLAAGVRAAAPFDPFHVAGIDDRPGAKVPMSLVFRDETGRAGRLADFAGGRPVLLVPVQHRCPNICGATLAGLVQAVKGQGARPGRNFTVLAFGIDPKEGPADAALSVQKLAALGEQGVHALTGPQDRIAAVTKALGYRYAWDPQLKQYDHVAAAAVLSRDGRLAGWLYGIQPPAQVLGATLTAAERGGIAAAAERLILFCYHYDPETGRYGPIAWGLLRGGAIAMMLALAGGIGFSLVRERRRRAAS